MQPDSTESFDARASRYKRKRGFTVLAAVVIIAAGGFGAYYHFVASHHISTNNAYVSAEVAEITPAVSGIVSGVNVVDTQYVKKGDVLVTLDDTDARLALQQAEASLGLAKRHVQGYLANAEGLKAQVQAREADERRSQADLTAAEADFERARIDLKRREGLIKSGSVSGEELSNAKNAFTQAEAHLNAIKAAQRQATANRLSAIGNMKANDALIADTSIETNPEVLLAKARLEQAQTDLNRTVIRSPISGVIAKREVQVGRRVQVGTPLLAVVPVESVHVDANFKEGKLRKVKVGQSVIVTSDLYGKDIVFHGKVTGLAGGTGSAFSLIPAQNATGNWIKVVQRLPVRIALDSRELKQHPLQVGLSMDVDIDITSAGSAEAATDFIPAELDASGNPATEQLAMQQPATSPTDEVQ